jgi:hypothetical protein
MTLIAVWHDVVACFASVAVQATRVRPTSKEDPDGGVHVVRIGAAPPVTVGVKLTWANFPLGATTVWGAGHWIASVDGLSTLVDTIALEVHEAVRFSASVTLQAIDVAPVGKSDPDGGVQDALTGAVPPDTIGAKVMTTGDPSREVADGDGHIIVGGAATGGSGVGGGFGVGEVDVTITDAVHDALNRSASIAVHVVEVTPTGKSVPEAGEHEAVTGAVPPKVRGANVTTTGFPSGDVAFVSY